MEGAVRVADALQWAAERSAEDILDLSIALETNAYDRYMIMMEKAEDDKVKQVFKLLSIEEKQHLGLMAELLDKSI
jgi:rubrerythrin